MNHHKPLFLPNSRNPFEIFLLIACILGGLGGVFNPDRASQIVRDVIPGWILLIWYSAIAIGGSVTLVGIIGSKLIFLFLERLGLVLLSGFSFGYSVVLISNINRPLALSALTTLFFSVACFVRLLQINRELKGGP